MVLFANFIGLAEGQGHRVINFAFHSYAPFFQSTSRDIYCQYPAAPRRSALDVIPGVAPALRGTRLLYRLVHAAARLNERWPRRGVITLRELPGREVTPLDGPEMQARIAAANTIFVEGWRFRAPVWVERHAERVRAYFQPLPCHAQASAESVDALRRQADIIVGVHVRRGDYQGWHGGEFFFPVDRYATWMRQLAGQFPGARVAFLVCSNEPRQAAEFPGLTVGFGPGVPVEDLFALAHCDYVMGPPSTFSQWASFYGQKPLWQPRRPDAEAVRTAFAVSWLAEVP